jgi:MinD-like ATPase involved in chromosome partitioning or flagellar assembly
MIQEVLTDRPPVATNGKAVATNGKATRRGKLSAHYHALVQRIHALNVAGPSNETVESIGVTSCARGAGVSTVAFNIAVAAARADMGPVLYVDADITKQAGRNLISGVPTLGLADVLADGVNPLDCVVNLPTLNLSIVAGRGTTKHDELTFDPFKTAEILSDYKCHFKLVVVDIPAPTELNGSIYLASQLDSVVLVIESELSDGRDALRTKQQLDDANANLLGVVLNKRRKHVPNWLDRLL